MSKKALKCDNCGDLIHDDQPKTAVKRTKGATKKLYVFHKDHKGCVESLHRRMEKGRGIYA